MDEVVGEPCEEFGAVVVPGQRQGGRAFPLLGLLLLFGQSQVGERLFVVFVQVPDLHAVLGRQGNPLQFGVEHYLVDFAWKLDKGGVWYLGCRWI